VVLASPDSPDEWAVAMRDLAQGDSTSDARAVLADKFQEMLHNESWLQAPSSGYLEAFDVAVYLGGTNFLPAMASLAGPASDPAVAHAAYLVLDRLVLENAAITLSALAADPAMAGDRPAMRADFFARGDVRDSQQRAVLESYLLNPSLSPAELDAFAGIFPNANYMISPDLLTDTPTPNGADLASRDAASLAAVQQWLQDPRFAGVRPQLQRAEARIQGFVSQAAQTP
jgi:hypothetical protein